jgi:hypothetical protein
MVKQETSHSFCLKSVHCLYCSYKGPAMHGDGAIERRAEYGRESRRAPVARASLPCSHYIDFVECSKSESLHGSPRVLCTVLYDIFPSREWDVSSYPSHCFDLFVATRVSVQVNGREERHGSLLNQISIGFITLSNACWS